jgi:hypothetical protein
VPAVVGVLGRVTLDRQRRVADDERPHQRAVLGRERDRDLAAERVAVEDRRPADDALEERDGVGDVVGQVVAPGVLPTAQRRAFAHSAATWPGNARTAIGLAT